MIDAATLRTLGWTDDLIAEVVRVADSISAVADRVGQVPTPQYVRPKDESGTAIYIGHDKASA